MYRSLYIHVPFCGSKCDYCAFYSVSGADPELRTRYLGRIEEELADHEDDCAPFKSIFVGGGTPTALDAGELAQLLSIFEQRDWMTRAEVTVECNPGSLSADKIAILGEFAINRVSLGVQSFQPEHRDTLGRAGPLDGLVDMLSALDREGISNIGMDLIYGIPGQELDDWRSDLHQACEHGIWHLSTYELTWEEGTRLAASNAEPVDEDRALEMWHLADDVTAEYGLSRYEVSNLSRAGRECAHNDAIWHGETYLGLGPAASSFDGTVRRSNPEDISAWLEGAPPERDELSPAERAAEILAFGLRTIRGWTPAEFLDATDHDYMLLRGETLDQLADEGLLLLDRRGVRPTQRGLLCADYIGGQLI